MAALAHVPVHLFLPQTDVAMVTHFLITLRINYCNMLKVGLPIETIQKHPLVQNTAAWVLMGTWSHDLITIHLIQGCWLPVHFQAQFLSIKFLYCWGLKYFKECFFCLSRILGSACSTFLEGLSEVQVVVTCKTVFCWGPLPYGTLCPM